jgi:acetoin utilization protein AcuB
MSMRVEEWMRHPVTSVKPLDSAAHARAIMSERRVNQLPVVAGPKIVGIVTDRDLRDAFPSLAEVAGGRGQPPRGADPANIPVEEVMTRDPLTIEPDLPLVAAARLLRTERIGALPVVHDGRLVGILTRSDLLDAFVEKLETE